MLNNQIVRACVQLGMMKPNRQKTFFLFGCRERTQFLHVFTNSTALHCCEGCYMLLHVVTRFAVWLGVTAHGLQSETSLNMLWVSENDAMPKLMAYHQYHQYHHIRHFLGGLPWFSMVYNDFYGESFRNRSLTVSCQVRFFVLKHWVPVCSCQCLFFGSCKIKPIHRSTNYLDLGLSQNSND